MNFSNVFNVDPEKLEKYGALDISLINDLPLFIDPFLLFRSEKKEYQKLHNDIIEYVVFLKRKSQEGNIGKGLIANWYTFPEVKQNWLGFCLHGNSGSGLGSLFAKQLNKNFSLPFLSDFGEEKVVSTHLEKLCLFGDGVGRDCISDFTTNLIKKYLLEYTQSFAKQNIDRKLCKEFFVDKVFFDYNTETWCPQNFILPCYAGDFVLLTPIDILTKDETWINRNSMIQDFKNVVNSIENAQLRDLLNNYFQKRLPKKISEKAVKEAKVATIHHYPEFVTEYIRYKEQHADQAKQESLFKVNATQRTFIDNVQSFCKILSALSPFFSIDRDSYSEAMERVGYLKQVIENNDGYKLFYDGNKQVVGNEKDLQLLFRFVWFRSDYSVDAEVNNGRGPVDYKISKGSRDSTLVEFKLASNSQLQKNLANQVEVYKKANQTKKGIKVILYFNKTEKYKVEKVLKELGLQDEKNIVLIDASLETKRSASKVASKDEYN